MFSTQSNPNFPDASLFLLYNGRCVGGASLRRQGDHQGEWAVTVNAPYDPETDSDIKLIGYAPDKQAAEKMLLENQDLVYLNETA